jgi:hypothetical protein
VVPAVEGVHPHLVAPLDLGLGEVALRVDRVDDPFHALQRDRRVAGHRLGQPVGLRFEFVGAVDDVVQQSDLEGVFAPDRVPREQQLSGLRGADSPDDPGDRLGAVDDAEFRGSDPEPGAFDPDADVTVTGEFHGAAVGVAVDHRDGRVLVGLYRRVDRRPQPFPVGIALLIEIEAGAEGLLARPGEHEDVVVVLRFEVVHRLGDRTHHPVSDRVPFPLVPQRQRTDPVPYLGVDRTGHGTVTVGKPAC